MYNLYHIIKEETKEKEKTTSIRIMNKASLVSPPNVDLFDAD